MKTLQLTKKDIKQVVDLLADNQIVGLATDTVMGLAIVADSKQAYDKLIEVKNRPLNKLFPIMVSDVKMLEKIVDLKKRDYLLINEFLPGKVTFVFNVKHQVEIVNLADTIAIRIVEDEFIREVVSRLNKPIFLTSANKSSENSIKDAKAVLNIFAGEIGAVVMEDAQGNQPSSIIDLSKAEIEIIREGEISLCDIYNSLKRSCVDE